MILELRVKPNARAESVELSNDGSLLVCVRAPPEDNKANLAVIKLLTRVLESEVRLVSGLTGRRKRASVDLDAQAVRSRISAAATKSA